MRTLLTILALSCLSFAQTTVLPKTTVFPKTTLILKASGAVAPSIVQVVGCGGVAGSITCTPAAVTGGNTALVMGLGNSSTCTTATGTGYSFLLWQTATVGGSNRHSVFVARNITGGSTTVTLNCTGTNSGAVFYELAAQSGQVVAADVIGSATGTGGTPSATTANSVGVSAEEVIATLYDNSNFRTLTAGSGYTMQQKVDDSSHSANCTTTCLIGSEEINTKTGLSGTQTGSITGVSTDSWNMSIVTLANTPAQDAADSIITWEGLTNAVKPTVSALQASNFGVPFTWTIGASSVFTGATGSQGTTFPASHQIGAAAWTGSGSLGLAFATGTATNDLTAAFPTTSENISWIGQFQTTIPQNDTNLNAYSLTEINDVSANDFVMPQLQSNGTKLVMAMECKTLSGSGTVDISTNTIYYVSINAVDNGGTHTMKVYDSTGVQVGSTINCTAEPGVTNWTNMKFGVNGAEAESSGNVISWDNVRLSFSGATLAP